MQEPKYQELEDRASAASMTERLKTMDEGPGVFGGDPEFRWEPPLPTIRRHRSRRRIPKHPN